MGALKSHEGTKMQCYYLDNILKYPMLLFLC